MRIKANLKLKFKYKIIILFLGLIICTTAITNFILLKTLKENIMIAAALIGIVILCNIIIVWIFSKNIIKLMNSNLIHLQKIYNGNFVEFDVDNNHDIEIKNRNVLFKNTVDKLRFLIKQIGYSSNLVAEAAIVLNVTAEE